jgi:hypothetical protein
MITTMRGKFQDNEKINYSGEKYFIYFTTNIDNWKMAMVSINNLSPGKTPKREVF